jgi:hypothetical protein
MVPKEKIRKGSPTKCRQMSSARRPERVDAPLLIRRCVLTWIEQIVEEPGTVENQLWQLNPRDI